MAVSQAQRLPQGRLNNGVSEASKSQALSELWKTL